MIAIDMAGSRTLPADPPEGCIHRQRQLVYDFEARLYSIQCRCCLITANEMPTGMMAHASWRDLMRAEIEDRRLTA